MTISQPAEPAVTAGRGALTVLFLATVIDMIGFGIVIPFLTYLVEDLATSQGIVEVGFCLLYTSPSPRDGLLSRMPSSA